MTKLTDLQSLLLAHAAGRDDHALTALPESSGSDPARVMKAITQLLRRGLLEEREVAGRAHHHRSDGDLHYGAFITATGLEAIGIETSAAAAVLAPAATPASEAPRPTKAALVLELLGREGGATLPELVAATGWLPHTTRAALTGLRQKGHAVTRERIDGVSHYRLVAAS